MGTPIGMEYLNTATTDGAWETYWFEKNFFGDIVAVYDNEGTKLVSYLYDAWGNQTITTHVAGTAAQYNPFRYRGYYYDADFGLYYLQSRYYDSMSFRFISPEPNVFVSRFDTGSGLVGFNVYAYCANNPVNYIDPTGEKSDFNAKPFAGYEYRQSDGWSDDDWFYEGNILRIGFSHYVTKVDGKRGSVYAYSGTTVDVLNYFGVTEYYGVGINVAEVWNIEVQAEVVGVGFQFSWYSLSIGVNVNLSGATSVTFASTSIIDVGTETTGFTLGINTLVLAEAILWVVKAYYTGDIQWVSIPSLLHT